YGVKIRSCTMARVTVAGGGPPPTAVTVCPAPQAERRTGTAATEITPAPRASIRFEIMRSTFTNKISPNGQKGTDRSIRKPGNQEVQQGFFLVSWLPYRSVGSDSAYSIPLAGDFAIECAGRHVAQRLAASLRGQLEGADALIQSVGDVDDAVPVDEDA